MITKLIKYFGLLVILSFSAISIFFALAQREIPDENFKRKIAYTSFFEDRFYDLRMKKTLNDDEMDNRLVLVKIDDHSIKKIGKWPLPRQTYATMMDKLKTFGAKVITYDVFFSEESLSCPGDNPDEIMAASIANFQSVPGNKVIIPNSLSPYNNEAYEEIPDIMYNFILDSKETGGVALRENFMEKKVFPIPLFQQQDIGIAHIEAEADADGIIRHYPVVGNVGSLYFPSLSLMTYQKYTGDNTVLEIPGLEDIRLKTAHGDLALNYKGETKIRWHGAERSFPNISIWDVMQAKDDDPKMHKLFNGNIAFIGSTAFGAHDLRHTPIDPLMPGIYFHINMTKMLLDGKYFRPTEDSTRLSWGILIIGTLLIIFIQFFGNPLVDLIGTISLIGGLYLYDTYVLLPEGYDIKLFFCLFSIGASYSWITFLHFYMANKDKAFLKSAFGSYISPELIDEMYKKGEAPSLGGDSGVRTAYFTDIQGFSTFSEKLSATQLVELLNEYLTAMTDILLEEKGTLDKYEGDAIIAFFGAPMPLEDHAARACLVAHRMQQSLSDLRKKWISEGDKWPTIVHEMRMRIGINSGEIVTGNMGSASRMNYTMMGDSVNLAARLEESAKQYGIFTQVAKETVELAGDSFLWRELDTVRVVGKSVPVVSYDLLGLKETADPYLHDLARLFKEGIEQYKSQQWDQALATFHQTLELEWQRFPDLKGKKTNPSEVYIERCKAYKDVPPPPDWDGVWTLTSK
jgi:adenylate cyclase